MPRERCTGCEIGRRAFLRDGATVVAAAAALGLPTSALAGAVALAPPAVVRGAERTYPIPAADGAVVDRENDVIVMRWQGTVYAFSLACPHQNTALRWLGGDARFQCPRHRSKYRPDGTFIEGRATRGLDRFPLRRDGASVVVDVDRLLKQTDDAAAWSSAVVRLGGA